MRPPGSQLPALPLALAIATMATALALAPGRVAATAPASPAVPASWPQDLLTAVNGERASLGLAPVRWSDRLASAAQAHVDDMVQRGYFNFTGPDGAPTIESLVSAADYQYRLVTEKLVRTSLQQTPAALATSWRAAPAANGASLFHPDVRELGAGVVDGESTRTIAIVLAVAAGLPEVDADEAAAFATLLRDPIRARKALYAAINQQRRSWALPSLRADSYLEEAASRHAAALLATLAAGRPTIEAGTLTDLVAQRDARWGSAGEITPGAVSRQRRSSNRGSNVGNSIGQVVVVDAATAEQALEVALAQTATDLREARFRVAGVGVASQPAATGGSGPRCVWVVALATR
jgi:uncharacterized protein YkwD